MTYSFGGTFGNFGGNAAILQAKMCKQVINVPISGINCTSETFLSPDDGTTQANTLKNIYDEVNQQYDRVLTPASTGVTSFAASGSAITIQKQLVMPVWKSGISNLYHVYTDIKDADGNLLTRYQSEDINIFKPYSFTLKYVNPQVDWGFPTLAYHIIASSWSGGGEGGVSGYAVTPADVPEVFKSNVNRGYFHLSAFYWSGVYYAGGEYVSPGVNTPTITVTDGGVYTWDIVNKRFV